MTTIASVTSAQAVAIDSDDNIFISNRAMSEIIKFNRENGELIWRLGGPMNDFTFINDLFNGPNRQHDARRLPNGNIMIFDNGDGRQLPFSTITIVGRTNLSQQSNSQRHPFYH